MNGFEGFDIGEIFNQLSLVTGSDVDLFGVKIRNEGCVGDMLPILSEAAEKLPDYLLGMDPPEILHRMVVGIYATKAGSTEAVPDFAKKMAKEKYESYVSTEELFYAIKDVLENIIIDKADRKYGDDAKYWADGEYRIDRISDEIEDEIFGDPIYACLDTMIEAIQEIEGMMSYDIDETGYIYDIVAPVQCGVMNLFENEDRRD